MAAELSVEATGETVGEAKWAALRELERLRPGLDKAGVRFEVVSEGERGLLGVGYAPARVVAALAEADVEARAGEATEDVSALASEIRSFVERITAELGVGCRVDVTESEGRLDVSCSGGDAGVLIGRHGQTIDAVQYLMNAVAANAAGERVQVTIDAADYRERRRATLESLAVRSARLALDTGERVELEAMSAIERKIVHVRLQDFRDVETSSEGVEPNRFVVISPVV
jgi:spoIIIJ-associated protein